MGKMPQQLEEMFRYKHVSPDVVFGRTIFTSQVAVGTTATLIAKALRPQVFLLVNANENANFFIGNSEVTVSSGFPILANNPLVFALLENVELYAVASAPIVAYVLEMGI